MTDAPVVHIGKVIRHAVAFNVQHWQGTAFKVDHLLDAVAELLKVLRERRVNYALVDGIALLTYVQGRNTEDIDLILSVRSLKKLPEIVITHKDVYFARGNYKGLQVDFLLTTNRLFSHVKKHHVVTQDFFEQSVPSATVRGLILLKLYALPSIYRQGDFVRVGLYENDIATLMFYYTPNMQEILDELTPFVSSQERTAIQEVIADLERRIARLRRGNV
ncbi:hypothetical protein [Roseiflexus sp.]|uniref:hypothetical protein n=1 Tax=Roseiflexus sp. TaxID=2562120 RepID=UPI0021DBC0FB|nr:hypothetical protein [Roseiflexus sp.]GIW01037.1 MAG: hypothetical protein KatS3mg058_2440 [Roseiflexus sp.]